MAPEIGRDIADRDASLGIEIALGALRRGIWAPIRSTIRCAGLMLRDIGFGQEVEREIFLVTASSKSGLISSARSNCCNAPAISPCLARHAPNQASAISECGLRSSTVLQAASAIAVLSRAI